eukprot:scaffold81145_cov64-Phaeocystis_antarctica.AAC.3
MTATGRAAVDRPTASGRTRATGPARVAPLRLKALLLFSCFIWPGGGSLTRTVSKLPHDA